jgi:hypothetical protein
LFAVGLDDQVYVQAGGASGYALTGPGQVRLARAFR